MTGSNKNEKELHLKDEETSTVANVRYSFSSNK